jgi:hypothetical protein
MLDIVPNHAGYFAPENIHEMTFTKPEYYHSCNRKYLTLQDLLHVGKSCMCRALCHLIGCTYNSGCHCMLVCSQLAV